MTQGPEPRKANPCPSAISIHERGTGPSIATDPPKRFGANERRDAIQYVNVLSDSLVQAPIEGVSWRVSWKAE